MGAARSALAFLIAAVSVGGVAAQPGDRGYEPAYDQVGGYGVGTLDERVAKLEKRLSGETLAEMLNRIEQLQGDVQRLHGQVEELTHELETVKKQQKDMYVDLDQRLQGAAPQQAQAPDAQDAAPAEDGATPSPPPAAEPKAPVAVSDSGARQAAYQKGFNLLKDGKYPESIREFKSFLAAYPSGEYSDNAVYWMAEAYYVMRDFPTARTTFRKLIKDQPDSAKVPDALLKIGYIEYDTNQWSNAREILNDIIKRYPGSSAAQQAAKRLAKMKQEGH